LQNLLRSFHSLRGTSLRAAPCKGVRHMRSRLVFFFGVSLLIAHELDAVLHTEWRLLYGLRNLNDSQAYPIFVLLHVVIFMGIFVFSDHRIEKYRKWFRNSVSAFMVIHALIHFSFIGKPEYTFNGWLSNGLIFGSAIFGLIFLISSMRVKNA